MTERQWLEQQIASLERQQAEAQRAAEQARQSALQCQGGLAVCRHRLAALDREETPRRLPVGAEAANGEVSG